MFKKLLFCLFIINLTSCGDLFMVKKKEVEATLEQFASCDLDTRAFSYILEKNIKGDLECLEQKLNLFIDAVKTDRPGFISRSTLNDFIVNGPIDIDSEITDIVDSLFQLNFLIQGGERDYISKKQMSNLFEIAKHFNSRVWKLYKYFASDDEVNYARHIREREIVAQEMNAIIQEVRKYFKNSRKQIDVIDSELFISKMFYSNPDRVEMIRSLMFLKRLFVGGERFELTNIELKRAFDKIPDLTKVAFDVVKFNKYNFQDRQLTLIEILEKDLDILKKNIFSKFSYSDFAFDSSDVLNALIVNVPDILDMDLSQYLREFVKVKSILLESQEEYSDFTIDEVHQVIQIADNFLFKSELFYRIYNYFRDELDMPGPLTLDFNEFPTYSSEEQEVLEDFARLSTQYRFVKGSFKMPFFSHEYGRNPDAYVELAGIELLVDKVMIRYGTPKEKARGGYDMDLDQATELVYDFKWVLKDLGIIKIGRKHGQEIQGIANNLVLMSTLFQYQSDGCAGKDVCMEKPEITEFIMGMITALTVKDFFTETMLEYCKDSLDEFDRISPECFRNNFIHVVEAQIPGDGRSLADYMPQMYSYLQQLVEEAPEGGQNTDSKSYLKFLFETESFTRSCMYFDEAKTEEVPLQARDAFSVFAGLLNVEATFLRFDTNQNNLMDANSRNDEVLYAYNQVYIGAIKALIDPDGGFMTRFSKPIFQYLIKYGEVPDTGNIGNIWRFVKFLLFKVNKKADATRTTISNILKTIGEQSGGDNPYKCEECWRDPTIECEPADDQWSDY